MPYAEREIRHKAARLHTSIPVHTHIHNMKILYRTKQIILLLGDAGSFVLGFVLAFALRNFSVPNLETLLTHAPLFSLIFALWFIVNYINGLYDLSHTDKPLWYRRVLETGLMSLILSILLLYLHPQREITPKTILLLNVLLGYSLAILWRIIYRIFIGSKRLQTRVLIVGYSEEIKDFIHIIQDHPERGYEISAIIDTHNQIPEGLLNDTVEVYKSYSVIRPAITKHNAEIVVTAPHLTQDQLVLRELYTLLFWPVRVIDFYTLYETLTNRVSPATFSEDWFLSNLSKLEHPVYNRFRRLTNATASVVLGIIFAIL